MFGAWAAAWPWIRSDLGLSYVEVGLLFALPHLFASLLEPPVGLLGDAWNRPVLVRLGGLGFVGGLLWMACSDGFASLLFALMVIFPASGAFVALSQATLMDVSAEPQRQALNMARWTLAGSLGVVAGPIVLGASAFAGYGWRGAFVALAGVGAAALALAWRVPATRIAPRPEGLVRALRDASRQALRVARRRDVVSCLVLLQLADLMLDVLHGFLALYFVDVAGFTAARAAMVLVLYTAIGLIGDALVIAVLKSVSGAAYLRFSAAAMLLVFPSFLLADDPTSKLVLIGAIAILNSGWYSIMMARLYAAVPESSGTIVAIDCVAGIAGASLPLLIGLAAERAGLEWAMWLLLAAPIALLLGVSRGR